MPNPVNPEALAEHTAKLMREFADSKGLAHDSPLIQDMHRMFESMAEGQLRNGALADRINAERNAAMRTNQAGIAEGKKAITDHLATRDERALKHLRDQGLLGPEGQGGGRGKA